MSGTQFTTYPKNQGHIQTLKKTSCLLEQPGLLPSFPQLRPGDVIIHSQCHNITPHTNYIEQVLAIDCTATDKMPTRMNNLVDLDEAKLNHLKYHLNNETKISNRPPQSINNIQISGESIVQEMNERNIILNAFTYDPLEPWAHKRNHSFTKQN